MIRVRVARESIHYTDDLGLDREWELADDATLGEVLRRTIDTGLLPATGSTAWLLLGVGRTGGPPRPLALLRVVDAVPQSVAVLAGGSTDQLLASCAPSDEDGGIPLRWHPAPVDAEVPWDEFVAEGASTARGWRLKRAAANRRWWRR